MRPGYVVYVLKGFFLKAQNSYGSWHIICLRIVRSNHSPTTIFMKASSNEPNTKCPCYILALCSLGLVIMSGCASSMKPSGSDAWHNDWQVIQTDSGDGQGPWVAGSSIPLRNRPLSPMNGLFCLHPVGRTAPAILRFTGHFDTNHPNLNITAASHAIGDSIIEVGLHPAGAGNDNFISLARHTLYSGLSHSISANLLYLPRNLSTNSLESLVNSTMFTVEIRVHSGGINDWFNEHAFIDEIRWSK